MLPSRAERLSTTEQHAVCATGALAFRTLRKWLLGDNNVRPVVLYRLRTAVQQLGLTDRFPELFDRPHGGAADPDPGSVIEPEDVAADAPAAE